MPAIHQFVAGFSRGDAISNEALVLRRIFRSWGCRSRILCEPNRVHPDLAGEADDVSAFAAQQQPDDIVLLHLSIGSRVNELFAQLSCRRVILYHNVTPGSFFRPVSRRIAADLDLGRRQIAALAGTACLNMADSRFNAAELEQAGYTDVRVLPLVLDLSALQDGFDPRVLRACRDGRTHVLFVGRGAPNKRIEDVLTAFALFRRHVIPESRLIHVGSFVQTERYRQWLIAHARRLGLGHDDFTLAGAVRQTELNAYYASASVFLCLSEHEGFCIPLIEAMAHHVPVLAYAAAAVPETLDGAGVLVREKRFDLIAEMMGRMVRDADFRQALVRAQDERVERYRRRDPADEVRRLLEPVLRPAG